MKNNRSVPTFLGAWSTKPDGTEQNQMCSHGSRERGINSTLPHLGSLMVVKRSSDLPKSPPVCIMLQRHSSLWGALCPRTFAFFYCWKVFLRKMYHFMETSLRGKIIAHATFRPSHHLNHFFKKASAKSSQHGPIMNTLWDLGYRSQESSRRGDGEGEMAGRNGGKERGPPL